MTNEARPTAMVLLTFGSNQSPKKLYHANLRTQASP
jgi:hypothetical protein